MKVKKFIPAARGLTAVMLSTVMLSTTVYGLAAGPYRSNVDGALGTSSYVINEDKDAARFKSDYATEKDMIAAAKAHAIKQGEEGFVLMKNDNNALPMTTGKTAKQKVALFGGAAYKPYQASGDLLAGNADQVDLVKALTDADFEINGTVKGIYDTILSKNHTESGPWGQQTTVYDYAYKSAPGDWQDEFQIIEVPADKFTDPNIGNAPANWKSSINKNETVGICVFARGAGEGNMYKPGSATDFNNNPTGKDPLALSADELSVVAAAKETCGKVIVLINSGNAMELGAIAKGGSHEVDAIGYIGVPNDYQFTGIVNVLSGKANATGALADTFVYNNLSAPATVNLGGGEYADSSIAAWDNDPRYPGIAIENKAIGSFDRGQTYSGSHYIVEAEGIYVGYKYYETRYYDSVYTDHASFNAKSVKGSTDGNAWDYNKEVVYTFGHGLSYYDYEQKVTALNVDASNNGNITATISIHNKSNTDGYFLGQLYVSTPYTDYDKQNNIEKAAISFLTSGKTFVKAGQTNTVDVTVPTKYLASYDSKTAKTYILDDGDYYFTAGAGAHEAVNNVLAAQGKTKADGMDADGDASAVKTWHKGSLDKTAFASDHGKQVTNQFDNADLNYYLPGKVTYLSRQDWDKTYPINYNGIEIRIGDSAKKDEWIREIRGQQYTIKTTGPEAVNVEGKDEGAAFKFKAENITYESLNDINNQFWQTLVNQISVSESVGGVIHGGSRTEVITNIDNPIVGQSEGVNGFTGTLKYKDEEGKDKTTRFNVSSQTLLATSFNPDLAYEWGRIQGNSGLWLKSYTDWGTGLTQRRTVYNGRNYEYISEDSMLTNIMGYGILKGTAEKGICTGPKHMGANDQEYMRAGIAEYMTEQKIREGDLRGFQGGLSEGGGLAVMIAFNRIGATNASHHIGMLQNVLRGEWGFKYIISTDMMSNLYYFNPEAMIMAGITQVADFSQNDFNITHASGGFGQPSVYVGHDSVWEYISVDSVKNDPELIQQARQNLKYQLYAFANSAVLNISTMPVTPWWEAALIAVIAVTGTLAGLAGAAWIACHVVSIVKKEED